MALEDLLASGADALGVTLTDAQTNQLLDYRALLERWNRHYNLTAIRDPEAMVVRHLLDSLSVLPHLDLPDGSPGELIDVGTGAGLPGMVLAIARPDLNITLLDSNGKKTRFMVQAKMELDLANVIVEHARVENARSENGYDRVLSRAFASLNDMIDGCHQLLADGGRYLAMKGQYPQEEIDAVRRKNAHRISSIEVETLVVPGLEEERCLVVLQ